MSGQLRLHSRGLSDVNNSQIRQRSSRGTVCSENGLSEKKVFFCLILKSFNVCLSFYLVRLIAQQKIQAEK